jgi:hypothetical protein
MRTQLLVIALALCVVGCQDQNSGMRARQDAALRDPMNYSPHTKDHTDISGGGMTDFKKDAFKRDVNSVFGP